MDRGLRSRSSLVWEDTLLVLLPSRAVSVEDGRLELYCNDQQEGKSQHKVPERSSDFN